VCVNVQPQRTQRVRSAGASGGVVGCGGGGGVECAGGGGVPEWLSCHNVHGTGGGGGGVAAGRGGGCYPTALLLAVAGRRGAGVGGGGEVLSVAVRKTGGGAGWGQARFTVNAGRYRAMGEPDRRWKVTLCKGSCGRVFVGLTGMVKCVEKGNAGEKRHANATVRRTPTTATEPEASDGELANAVRRSTG